MASVISTTNLSKAFGPTVALDSISLSVQQGEIYGFLGLNGAGKTTLIRILLAMIKASGGSVELFGTGVRSFTDWNKIGYLVETPYAYPNLTVKENLEVISRLRCLQNARLVSDIIEKLKLSKYADTKSRNLSLGNQQRLGIAKALIHSPDLLILDEPINGLDPEGIVEVRELLIELSRQGATIFLSSHILTEISKMANRIGIIHHGRLMRELTDQQLKDSLIRKLVIQTMDDSLAVEQLRQSGYNAVIEGDTIVIENEMAIAHPESISALLVEKGFPPRKLLVYTEDLEMFFLRTIRNR